MAGRSKGKRRGLSKQELRAKYADARRDLSKLKAKGLISPKANLHKAKPSLGLRKKLEVLRPILTGHAQAVKLPRAQRVDFKEAGFTTIRGLTVVKKEPYENVKVTKEGLPELKQSRVKKGAPFLRRIILPANVRRMDKFEEFLRDQPERFKQLAPDGALFGFTYFGNRSREIVPVEKLYNYLQRYDQIFGDEGKFEQLILYAMDYSNALRFYHERDRSNENRRSFYQQPKLDEQGRANRRAREAARKRASRKRANERYEF